jgi:hypothetical protein
VQIVVVQLGPFVTVAGAASYTHMHVLTKAKLDLWLLLLHAFMPAHARATAKLESQRTAGSNATGEGTAAAGRTKALLCYCRIHKTPGVPEDTRGDKEGHQRDRRAQRHYEDRRAQRGIGRDTKRTGGNNGGIRAGHKATRTQHGAADIYAHVLVLLYDYNTQCCR